MLLVCSESTKDFIDGFDKIRVVKEAPDISILDEIGSYENVTAIGGGAVIDTAKILAKNSIVSNYSSWFYGNFLVCLLGW